jgi:5-methylcytosine-specific restriction endonuclease McrA
MRYRQPSALGDLLTLLFLPLVWPFRQRRATQEQIKRFYRSKEWKTIRYDVLARSPRCRHCGTSAAKGAEMRVDHRKPLHKRWDLRLKMSNLQTLCEPCNWGKGGR